MKATTTDRSKQYVDLAAEAAKPSRIRREPPPAVAKKTLVPDRDLVDRRGAAVGIIVFALAITVTILVLGNWAGWSPRDYNLQVELTN